MSSFIMPFEKMHGLGNDFVMVHYRYLPPHLSESNLAKLVCDRHFSVGADGLIIVKPPSGEPTQENGSLADFAWSYINADGSPSQMCGNGIRCFAKYVYDRGLTNKSHFGVETGAGVIEPSILEDGQICVKMGQPILEPHKVPVSVESAQNSQEALLDHPIEAADKRFTFSAVSMGNPHAIIFLEQAADKTQSLQNFDLAKYGSLLEVHPFFPEKSNIEFAQIVSPTEIDLRVWERGCGITLACGTGACATVVAATLKGLVALDQDIAVNLPGGRLSVRWEQASKQVYMTGPAESVFVGQLELTV